MIDRPVLQPAVQPVLLHVPVHARQDDLPRHAGRAGRGVRGPGPVPARLRVRRRDAGHLLGRRARAVGRVGSFHGPWVRVGDRPTARHPAARSPSSRLAPSRSPTPPTTRPRRLDARRSRATTASATTQGNGARHARQRPRLPVALLDATASSSVSVPNGTASGGSSWSRAATAFGGTHHQGRCHRDAAAATAPLPKVVRPARASRRPSTPNRRRRPDPGRRPAPTTSS